MEVIPPSEFSSTLGMGFYEILLGSELTEQEINSRFGQGEYLFLNYSPLEFDQKIALLKQNFDSRFFMGPEAPIENTFLAGLWDPDNRAVFIFRDPSKEEGVKIRGANKEGV